MSHRTRMRKKRKTEAIETTEKQADLKSADLSDGF